MPHFGARQARLAKFLKGAPKHGILPPGAGWPWNMRKLVWLGNPFFSSELPPGAFRLVHLNYGPGEYFDWRSLHEAGGIDPGDVLVLADNSLPPALLGVENFPCLTVFYSVDSHIHSWHPLYAQAFDLCLVSLKDHLTFFQGKRLQPEQVHWLPPCCLYQPVAPDKQEQSAKRWDLLFVGTVDRDINPERATFMENLRARLPGFHYCRGKLEELSPYAKLILNHSIAGDLNFRVFEALGNGACLLTPRLGHGQEELFTDQRDLFLYNQQDMSGLLALIGQLLDNAALCRQAARSGFNKIISAHLGAHRASTLAALLAEWRTSGKDRALIRARRQKAAAIWHNYLRLVYLHFAEHLSAYPDLRQAYLAAGRKNAYALPDTGQSEGPGGQT